jgi:guanyl-specific ribonuclease Sa
VGRDLQALYQRQNEEVADTLSEGEAVQYWDDGLRYGTVEKLPAADEKRYGDVRILHAQTGRVWVAGRDVRRIV